MTDVPDNTPKDKSLMIFGRDVSKVPCYRNSILYGIGGGLSCGLARFMFTSQPVQSVNFSVYSFAFISLGYWIQCRYEYSKKKFEMARLQELLQRNALLEGTEDPDIIASQLGTEPVDV